MKIAKRAAALCCAAALLAALCSCAAAPEPDSEGAGSGKAADTQPSQTADLKKLRLDGGVWRYDKAQDVYWQSGAAYCSAPRDAVHETLSVFVPGKYFHGKKNKDGTYTCSIDYSAKINDYTAATAPMLLAVNTTEYEAKTAPAFYHDAAVGRCLKAGMVYVSPGLRGTGGENPGGAPWGAADLKAAVRFLRLNMERLPGDPDRIFAFGAGAGAALSAILGASGDSAEYLPYLDSVGAALYDEKGTAISDAVRGVMCWNFAPAPDTADSAYEWMLGQYSKVGTRAEGAWTAAFSRDLAAAFAGQINRMKLKDEEENALTLEATRDGVYTSGGYADGLRSLLEKSLNRYLKSTKFPSTVVIAGKTVRCQTAEDYIDALNGGDSWISYDGKANTVRITDLGGFSRHCAGSLKEVGAFDGLGCGTPENRVFAGSDGKALHFDAVMSALLAENQNNYAAFSGWKASRPADYAADLKKTDELGGNAEVRRNLYNPLYFLCRGNTGCGTSTTAAYWRVNCGVCQNGAAVVDSLNLTLALRGNEHVKEVRFAPIWIQKGTLPESAGSGSENFIRWVKTCCPVEE